MGGSQAGAHKNVMPSAVGKPEATKFRMGPKPKKQSNNNYNGYGGNNGYGANNGNQNNNQQGQGYAAHSQQWMGNGYM